MKLYFYIHSEIVGTELVKTIPATPKNITRIEKWIGDFLVPNQEETLQVDNDGQWRATVILQ